MNASHVSEMIQNLSCYERWRRVALESMRTCCISHDLNLSRDIRFENIGGRHILLHKSETEVFWQQALHEQAVHQ